MRAALLGDKGKPVARRGRKARGLARRAGSATEGRRTITRARKLAAAVLLPAVAVIAVSLTAPMASSASAACDLVAAPNGLDSNPGTESAPLRSADELIDRLRSGQAGCFRQGTYGTEDQFWLREPSVTLRSYPGERATLQGRVRVEHTADDAVIENLILDGRDPEGRLGPLIYADRVVLRGNEIFNNNQGICVHIADYPGEPPPTGVLIEDNEIRDCGRLPATNHDHGIYVANARDTVIRNNLIYNNADRGIQLYPDADGTLVTGNVIDGNGQGVIFGGDGDDSSDNNTVTGNVITNATIRYNVSSSWQGPTGSGNVARGNCVWTSRDEYAGSPEGSGIQEMSGASASGNVIANPGYANPAAGDFRIDPQSECAAVLAGAPPIVQQKPPKRPNGDNVGGAAGASCASPTARPTSARRSPSRPSTTATASRTATSRAWWASSRWSSSTAGPRPTSRR